MVNTHSLTLLTYNLWFDAYRWEVRIAAVLRLINRYRPHLIGLQEVTPGHLERILAEDWVRRRYQLSDTSGETLEPHGVLLLSRLPLGDLTSCRLPSNKDRKFVIAQVETGCGRLHVGTLHLESSPTGTAMRVAQLESVLPRLRAAGQAVLMGDFNFDPRDQAEQSVIERGYTDLWPALRGDAPGYTLDSVRNPMRLKHKRQEKRVRFDRILLRSNNPHWVPMSVRLIGTRPISPQHPEVYPSDHFGLVGVVTCAGEWVDA